MESYKELRVWQAAMELAEQVYRETAAFPMEERFGLTSQARRAAISIPANIAEGWGRHSTADYLHFLMISRGSLMELETHLLLACRLGFLTSANLPPMQEEIASTGKLLNALIKSLRQKS